MLALLHFDVSLHYFIQECVDIFGLFFLTFAILLKAESLRDGTDSSSYIHQQINTMSTDSASTPTSVPSPLAAFSQLQKDYTLPPSHQSVGNDQSDSDESSTSDLPISTEPWSNKGFALKTQHKMSFFRLFGAKSLSFKRKEKTKTKGRWRKLEYHVVKGRTGLEEDPSVASMNSFSSRINLLYMDMAEHVFSARTKLPNSGE